MDKTKRYNNMKEYNDYLESLKEIAKFNCNGITCDECALKVTIGYDGFYKKYHTGCMSCAVMVMFDSQSDGKQI